MSLSSRHIRSRSINTSEDMITSQPIRRLSTSLESKFDELKTEVVSKIDREMSDSCNAREYIAHKYEELTDKIKSLAELDSTVSSFRSEVRSLERALADLARRVDQIERRTGLLTPV